MPSPTTRAAALLAAAIVPLLVAGCSSGSGTDNRAQADAVTVTDQWVKAADTGMSAAFARFTNDSDREVRLVDATGPAAARMEIHETVDANGSKTMRPKAGGLAIPAHGSVTLSPGGDHLMFLDLKAPLRTGSQTPITVKYADGSAATFTAQVRDFAGNKESYTPADSSAHGG